MMSDGRPVLLAHNCVTASASDDEKHSSRCLHRDRGVTAGDLVHHDPRRIGHIGQIVAGCPFDQHRRAQFLRHEIRARDEKPFCFSYLYSTDGKP